MVEWLILVRPDLGRDRLVPVVGIVENRVDVEYHAAERIKAVADDLADLIFGVSNLVHRGVQLTAGTEEDCKDDAPARFHSWACAQLISRTVAPSPGPFPPLVRQGQP